LPIIIIIIIVVLKLSEINTRMINRLGTPGAVGFFKCLDELYWNYTRVIIVPIWIIKTLKKNFLVTTFTIKNPTAPGVPKRSPIQVLSGPNVA